MIISSDLKVLMLAMPMLLAGCCDTKQANVMPPSADIMQPPEVTEFLAPLLSLTSELPQKEIPNN